MAWCVSQGTTFGLHFSIFVPYSPSDLYVDGHFYESGWMNEED
jgi:hypothetical protein